jgi:RNA recognition motif-containing protein
LKKLFVGNLPYQASEGQLEDWFQQAGFQPQAVSIIKDRFSGEPRGFGFVEIGDDAEADKAINACNGQDFLGRSLVVNEARPMTERPPSRFGGGAGAGARAGGRAGGGEDRRRSRNSW